MTGQNNLHRKYKQSLVESIGTAGWDSNVPLKVNAAKETKHTKNNIGAPKWRPIKTLFKSSEMGFENV